MTELPMIAIGNDELGDDIGADVECKRCGQRHPVQYGEAVMPDYTRQKSSLLAFYRCGEKTYLCGIDGRAIL